MRLKQLLAILLPLVIFCTVAFASAPQLSKVSVLPQGNTTTVTLHTNGAFTHNEYRPADNLLLVDLVGISAGKFNARSTAVQSSGVSAYRVISYSGAGGVQIARLELTLSGRPEVHINPPGGDGTMTIQFVVPGTAATAAPAAATPVPLPASSTEPVKSAKVDSPALPVKPVAASPQPVKSVKVDSPASPVKTVAASPQPVKSAKVHSPAPPTKPVAAASRTVEVKNVAVRQGTNGFDTTIEVFADGPLTARTMKLTSPERLVVDLIGAVPAEKPKTVNVNAKGVIAVRIGRFQANPPITRLVIDLQAARDFDIANKGNQLSINLRSPAATAAAPATTQPPAAPVVAVPVVAENTPAASPAAGIQAKPVSPSRANLEPEYKGGDQAAKDLVIVQPNSASNGAPAAAPAMAAMTSSQAAEAPATAPGKGVNFAADQRTQQTMPSGSQPKYTGEPISVNLKDVDLKDFFRLIHEISGLNIVLDPKVSGSLSLVLDDVPWDQALDLVLENNSLSRQLQGNVLRIATLDTLKREANARRDQQEAQMLAVERVTTTRFLSYAHAKDVVNSLKKMLTQRGTIEADDRTNGLIITDVPSVMGPIDALLAQLDRKTQEVEIEARVIAATRNFAREVGTQLAFAWANNGGSTAVGGNPSLPPSSISNSIVPVPPNYVLDSTGTKIPLFTNFAAKDATSGLSFLNVGHQYRLDAFLSLAESRGLLKVLSRPRIVTQNNVQAIIKQGQRIPVVTQSQLQGPPTVTYIEALLRLTVTPQITVENTIFMNVDIENTTADMTAKVQDNPVLFTQQTTTQVLVKDGGTVVIGGVMQTQNSLAIQQVPLLGSVPGLGNLFKHRSVQTSTQELIFFITPRIIET